jgi:small conductance mechanosensitive channel
VILRRTLIALLLVTQLASAQEETVAPELLELPADIAAEFEQRVAAIQLQERAVKQINKNLESAEGLRADLYGGRVDSIWAAMFSDTVQLAQDIAEQQENGFEVSAIAAEVSDRLRVFPEESTAALDRLRSSVVYPTDDMAPPELAITDQYLLRAMRKFDFVLQSMVTYLAVAENLGMLDESFVDFLVTDLENSAANRSTFLQLALEDVTVLRAASAALPADAEVSARLAVHEARITIATDSLQDAVTLMNELELDTSHYSQQLVTTTGELTADVLDVSVLSGIISDWTTSVADVVKSKGPQLLFRLLIVVLILFIFSRLGRLAQALTKRAMKSSKVRVTKLLTEMVVATVKNFVIFLGILIALSQVGISLGPLLAGLGIAGFIVGFALQDTLSNFASGMLILLYRPFDVGDFVTAGGVTGKVSHMSLVNTTFKTIDNQVLVVPNNLIWQTVITNVTAQRLRRVDLTFGVAYSDDIEKVERILLEVVTEHELILDEPEPMIKLHELADSSVNFVCRPWVKTDDYWDVYWYLLRTVKLRFDAEGITIPFPQREIHNASE